MATISVTLSATDFTRTVDALGLRWGYQATINGIVNPQSKGEFVRLQIAQWIKDEVRANDLTAARAAVTVTDVIIT